MLYLISVLLLDYLLVFSCTNYVWFVLVWCCVLYTIYYIYLTTILSRRVDQLTASFSFFSAMYNSYMSNVQAFIFDVIFNFFYLVILLQIFFKIISELITNFISYSTYVIHIMEHLLSGR